MKFRYLIIISLVISLFGWLGLGMSGQNKTQAQAPDELLATGKLEPDLLAKFEAAPIQKQPVIVMMAGQADLSLLNRQPNTLTRREIALNILQNHAAQTQADIRKVLAEAEARGQASQIRPLWIINALALQADQELVLTLAARDDVALIRPDQTISLYPELAAQKDQPIPLELSKDWFDLTEIEKTASTFPAWGIERIRAPEVWSAFEITGQGVVVASLDSGVDYQHPDLRSAYRGYQEPGLPEQHYGNWFDATGFAAAYPVDTNGHGTHTLGTILGQNGIGVAPGATWIAVKAFNSNGQALESWLHTGFEWLIAPAGDPALAPNLVNNSWSNTAGTNLAFEPDFNLLRRLGIIPIFATGNAGPDPRSVGAPASYTSTISVGAVDSENLIAYFSGRGPSPWAEIKPLVTAPGVKIPSTFPGGGYALSSGTSMATPHVTGVAALMLAGNAALNDVDIARIIKQTASPLDEATPNNIYGWGLIDAYRAVEEAIQAGQIRGQIIDSETQTPISYATITIRPRINNNTGRLAQATTNAQGYYVRGLSAGDYNLNVTAFGYQGATQIGLQVMTNTVITQNFALAPLPTGQISGQVRQAYTNLPLSATITVENTPLSVQTDPTTGAYELALPAGVYTLTYRSRWHRTERNTIIILNDQNRVQHVSLITAPTILLIDSGAWYNESQIRYYETALDQLGFDFDTYRIRVFPDDLVQTKTLNSYQIIIWSAPLDSPGIVRAALVMRDILKARKALLLSGQDIAFYDSGLVYYAGDLKTQMQNNNSAQTEIKGLETGLFQGLSLNLGDQDGANNQYAPDSLIRRDIQAVEPVLTYPDGQVAAQKIGRCLTYRALVFGFGLEGIDQLEDRMAILDRSLAWFQSAPIAHDLRVFPQNETRVGLAGETIEHKITIRNNAEVGADDTFTISLSGQTWETQLDQVSLDLAPCSEEDITFQVTVPAGITLDQRDQVTITVQSTLSPTMRQVITRVTKSPAPLLLVDDDRWYDFEDRFIEAFKENGISYDYWSVQGANRMGTPPLAMLKKYPMIVWFTAYDWFNPLTPAEETTLQAYLDQGGRLAFASQEYLYVLPDHAPSIFARDYFGVAGYTEFFSTTATIGVPGHPIGDKFGPYRLNFPSNYQNWTDSLTPTITATVALLNQSGHPNALTVQGGLTQTWHTAFFGFGPELLPAEARTQLLKQTVGWLSWLGTSQAWTEAKQVYSGDYITYTTVLRHDGVEDIKSAKFTGHFPDYLIPDQAGLQDRVRIAGNDIVWQGPLHQNQMLTFTYRVRVSENAPYGVKSRHAVEIAYDDHDVKFDRLLDVPVNIPVWTSSTLTVTPSQAALQERLTYTLELINDSVVDVPMLTVTTRVPDHLSIATGNGTMDPGGLGPIGEVGTVLLGDSSLTWLTPVSAGERLRLGYQAQVIQRPYPFTFPVTFEADDGYTKTTWTAYAYIEPAQVYLPIIQK